MTAEVLVLMQEHQPGSFSLAKESRTSVTWSGGLSDDDSDDVDVILPF